MFEPLISLKVLGFVSCVPYLIQIGSNHDGKFSLRQVLGKSARLVTSVYH